MIVWFGNAEEQQKLKPLEINCLTNIPSDEAIKQLCLEINNLANKYIHFNDEKELDVA